MIPFVSLFDENKIYVECYLWIFLSLKYWWDNRCYMNLQIYSRHFITHD